MGDVLLMIVKVSPEEGVKPSVGMRSGCFPG